MHISYITDQRPGERDILTGLELNRLEIRDLAGEVLLTVDAPSTGWTHESLSAVQTPKANAGADAWLSDQWVGSTEL